jgi:cell division protein FtsB
MLALFTIADWTAVVGLLTTLGGVAFGFWKWASSQAREERVGLSQDGIAIRTELRAENKELRAENQRLYDQVRDLQHQLTTALANLDRLQAEVDNLDTLKG